MKLINFIEVTKINSAALSVLIALKEIYFEYYVASECFFWPIFNLVYIPACYCNCLKRFLVSDRI